VEVLLGIGEAVLLLIVEVDVRDAAAGHVLASVAATPAVSQS
jgi:hypothetical protein